MNEKHHEPDQNVDADINGHLAMALFVGVIVVILIMIYALAIAG